jgi:hypothetical protein
MSLQQRQFARRNKTALGPQGQTKTALGPQGQTKTSLRIEDLS